MGLDGLDGLDEGLNESGVVWMAATYDCIIQ